MQQTNTTNTFTYLWDWREGDIPDDIGVLNEPAVTFTIPSASENSNFSLALTIEGADSSFADLNVLLTAQDAGNNPPEVNAGPDLLDVTREQVIPLLGATATDDDDDNLTYTWTVSPTDAVTFNSTAALNPTITVSGTVPDGQVIILTLTVNDDTVDVSRTRTLTIQDAVTNNPPTVNAGPDLLDVTREQVIPLLGATATDDDDDNLTYTWTVSPTDAVTFNSTAALNPTITVSGTVPDGQVIILTLTVNDDTVDVSRTRTLTIQDAVTNNPPTVNAGPDLLDVTREQVIPLLGATATDDDGDNLTYTWTVSPTDAVTFNSTAALNPTITVSGTVPDGQVIILTLTVNDDTVDVSRTRTLTIFDPTNVAPTIYKISVSMTVKERTSVTLTGAANDPNPGDTPKLKYLWLDLINNFSNTPDVTGKDTQLLRFTAPGISSGTESFEYTLTVTDIQGLPAPTRAVTVTVEDVPLKVSSVTYNPGNGQLRITFNQNIEPNPSYDRIHVRSADFSSGGISLSDVTAKSSDGAVITATLSTEQKETYADLQNPQIDIDSGAVSDVDGASIDATPDMVITTISKKKSSSSSSAPIVDLNRLVQARIVDIPSVISEQVSSRNAADPLEPILDNNTFDFPLTINDYYYLIDSTTNTLTPRTVTVGQSTEIKFTVYTDEDLAYFILYLNLQDDDTRYADSDTYITYTNDGTVTVTDPNEYIADATITVTQEDNSMPEKKTVTITIEFDEPMGLTNMVAYMWNTDRKSTIINLIDAIDVTAAAETRQNGASTADSSTSARVTPESDVSDDNRSDGGGSQSGINSGIAVIGGGADNDDDVQTLSMIRMWSGFASESITDAELLESMGLDNYPTVHIPDWVMTELGALVSNNDVTVEEFRTALVYMLEMLTA